MRAPNGHIDHHQRHSMIRCASSASRRTTGPPPLYVLVLIARSTSRPASRALIDSRRSYCLLPLARPISTLACPRLEKYTRSGTSVSPFCWVLPISLLISFRCNNSFLALVGSWFIIFPWL